MDVIALREECLYSEIFWSVSSRIQYKWGKIRTKKIQNTDTFHPVIVAKIFHWYAKRLPKSPDINSFEIAFEPPQA